MNSFVEDIDDHGDAALAPGDLYIDNTNTTLFQVMDYSEAGCTPSQMVEALGITYDQVLLALDYIEQHRIEVEAAYQADVRAATQHVIHALVGSYSPQWQDWMLLIGGIGVGILLSVIGVMMGRQVITPDQTEQSTFMLLGLAALSLFCGVVGIAIIFLGIRLVIDTFSLHYAITETSITATRYGGIPAYTIPTGSIDNASFGGQFFHFTCEGGKTYRMLVLKQIRDAVNDMPVRESESQR